jgi:hypothetical protein
LEEEIGGMRYLSGVKAHHDEEQELFPEEYSNFCLESINREIASMKMVVQEESTRAETPLTRYESIDPGISDVVPVVNTFQSSDRHSDVTPNDLSERWGISIATATKTLKKTTQKFLRSAVLPLARRYRADRVFVRKTLAGELRKSLGLTLD